MNVSSRLSCGAKRWGASERTETAGLLTATDCLLSASNDISGINPIMEKVRDVAGDNYLGRAAKIVDAGQGCLHQFIPLLSIQVLSPCAGPIERGPLVQHR